MRLSSVISLFDAVKDKRVGSESYFLLSALHDRLFTHSREIHLILCLMAVFSDKAYLQDYSCRTNSAIGWNDRFVLTQ